MKKKLIILTLAAVMLFSSCGTGQANVLSSATGSTTAENTKTDDTTADNTTADDTAAPTEQSGQTENSEVPLPKAELSDYGDFKELLIPDFYVSRLSNVYDGKILAAARPAISPDTGVITVDAALINLDDYSYTLKNLALEPVVSEENRSSYEWCDTAPYILNGSPILFETDTGAAWLLDDKLEVIESTDAMLCENYFNAESTSISPSGITYLSSVSWSPETEDRYFSLTVKDGHICAEKIGFPVPENNHVDKINSFSDDELLLCTFDSGTYETSCFIFDKKSGSCTKIESPLSENNYFDYTALNGKLIRKDYTSNSLSVDIFSPETPNLSINAKFRSGNFTVITTDTSAKHLYVSENIDEPNENSDYNRYKKVYVISAETGNTLDMANTGYSCDTLEINCAAEYGGSVLLEAFTDVGPKLLLWEPKYSEENHSWSAVTNPDYERIKQAANDIKEKYDINVYYGDEAVQYFTNYAALSETRPENILNGLNALKTMFDSFPEGFISEIRETSGINIYLTGTIKQNVNSDSSISSCAGFVESQDDLTEMLVVDISGYGNADNIDLTLPHEFMHIIEDTINRKAYNEGYTLDRERFTLWSAINPPDFSYIYKYNYDFSDTEKYQKYTPLWETLWGNKNDSAYFFDSYSMTYPHEDRARFFENYMFDIFGENTGISPSMLAGNGMQLKMEYLCLCLRDCFDSLKDCGDIVWEKQVNIEHDLEWFRENYRLEEWMAMG